jgi:hypothetical protein
MIDTSHRLMAYRVPCLVLTYSVSSEPPIDLTYPFTLLDQTIDPSAVL